MKDDIYQKRYLKHQERKRKILSSKYGSDKFRVYTPKEQKLFFEILKNRRSQRSFNDKEIDLSLLLDAIETSPSSCNRKGVSVFPITKRDDKDLLSGILVGGVGWIHRAHTILLLKADMTCYKSPAEKEFMPYLDAGVIVQTCYLACEAMNMGCCFVNPNIRPENRNIFYDRFDIDKEDVFCGALAVGNYDLKHL